MTFSIVPTAKKSGHIAVTEDQQNFLVSIHYRDKDRAKMIAGRQWDGARALWVYPKTIECYDSLSEQFKRDADLFDIRKPKTRRPPDYIAPKQEDAEDDFGWPELDEIGEGQTKLQEEIADIRNVIGLLRESVDNQGGRLTSILSLQKESSNWILNQADKNESPASVEHVDSLPDKLNIVDNQHISLLEGAVITIAYSASDANRSFGNWLIEHEPLLRPHKFVTEAHEILKESLEELVGEKDPRTKFYDLVHRAKDDDLIYPDTKDSVKTIPALLTLNTIRNKFAHSRGKGSDTHDWSLSLIYLMNLAHLWPKLVMNQDDE